MTRNEVPSNRSLRVSVIIPTLNEAAYLPNLLEALAAQTYPATEVIVADAGSTDGTPELARRYGAWVVQGGTPAVGRNAGARVASGDLFLFLDADVVPFPDFIERAVMEFLNKQCDVATVRMVPWDGNLVERVVHDAANLCLILMQSIFPHAPGFCILIKRELHKKIGGFDERLLIGRGHRLCPTCCPIWPLRCPDQHVHPRLHAANPKGGNASLGGKISVV
jgi:glycosyltransferase involved in cell wall biosynthesis